jgi:hypothetical protein
MIQEPPCRRTSTISLTPSASRRSAGRPKYFHGGTTSGFHLGRTRIHIVGYPVARTLDVDDWVPRNTPHPHRALEDPVEDHQVLDHAGLDRLTARSCSE